jgi:hypothetical protein
MTNETNTNTVKILISVDKSTAIGAGKAQWGLVVGELDLAATTPEQRELLASLPPPYTPGIGADALDAANLMRIGLPDVDGQIHMPDDAAKLYAKVPDASASSIIAVIDSIAAIRAAIKQTRAASAARLAAEAATFDRHIAGLDDAALDALAEKVTRQTGRVSTEAILWNVRRELKLDELTSAHAFTKLLAAVTVERLTVAVRQLTARQRASTEAAEKRREAEARAREKAKRDQFEEWVNTLCSDEQRRRHAARLLPEREVLAAVRNMLFRQLDAFPRYERMSEEEIRKLADTYDSDYDSGVEFDSGDADEASPEEFATLERIKAAVAETVPDAECQLREHTASVNGTVVLRRKSVLVRITRNGWLLSREYACP